MSVHGLDVSAKMGLCSSDPDFDAERNGYDLAYGPSLFRFGDADARKSSYRDVDEINLDNYDGPRGVELDEEDDSDLVPDEVHAILDARENEQRDDWYNGDGWTREAGEDFPTGYEGYGDTDIDDTDSGPYYIGHRRAVTITKKSSIMVIAESVRDAHRERAHTRIFRDKRSCGRRGRNKRIERRDFVQCDVYVSA